MHNCLEVRSFFCFIEPSSFPMRAVKTLAILRICAGSSELRLLDDGISTTISCAGYYMTVCILSQLSQNSGPATLVVR